MTLEDTVFESIATYSCREGYTLSGDDTRMCVGSGEWSGEAPLCEGVCYNTGHQPITHVLVI